ncbi:hypothetical protein [Polaromonas sp. C04]|uniref:hypothetical protein n=1 Tax=Polaromonas sp. C04 TaxID=1945857 RepID=UPI000986EF48|nr:hypothetical protein [Polaromonas sp. C04]OOG55974.1 hypothetical protein B0E49_06330 [Polaromonas sp. C04]
MIRLPIVALFAALLSGSFFLTPVAGAVEGSVTITSPKDGAKLDVMNQTQLVYDVVPGPRGDHVHVYVDDKEVGILRQLKGSYTLESLAAGQHAICIKVVNKAHTPIGLQRCVNVSVE